MVEQKQNLFRKESLERLSSPERLDQLMQVVNSKSWLPLVSLGSLVIVALAWSIYGRIPITVEGRGVLIYPSKVVSLQSKSSGQLMALNVKVGDLVKKGDVLATVDQTELNKQLQLARNKLSQLQGQDRNVNLLQRWRNELTEKTIQQQRQFLQQNLKTTQALTPILREKSIVSLQAERQTQMVRLQTVERLLPILKDRWDARQFVYKQGALSKDQVLQAQREYQESRAQKEEVQAQLKQLESQEVQAQREYLNNQNSITDIQAKLRELDSQEVSLRQQDLETATNRKKEIQEVEREIAKLELQLGNNSEIISQHSGRILEITVNPGQVIDAGTRLGSIDAEKTSSKLLGITYFAVGDGKKIQPNMTLQITPQTVKRERFGGIVGKVTAVSPLPITTEAAKSVVGNPEVVEGLVSDKQDGVIQIFADLEPDSTTFSSYKWSSSKGPQLKISPGTTTVVRVKVEERAPITFVLPILRSYSGIY